MYIYIIPLLLFPPPKHQADFSIVAWKEQVKALTLRYLFPHKALICEASFPKKRGN